MATTNPSPQGPKAGFVPDPAKDSGPGQLKKLRQEIETLKAQGAPVPQEAVEIEARLTKGETLKQDVVSNAINKAIQARGAAADDNTPAPPDAPASPLSTTTAQALATVDAENAVDEILGEVPAAEVSTANLEAAEASMEAVVGNLNAAHEDAEPPAPASDSKGVLTPVPNAEIVKGAISYGFIDAVRAKWLKSQVADPNDAEAIQKASDLWFSGNNKDGNRQAVQDYIAAVEGLVPHLNAERDKWIAGHPDLAAGTVGAHITDMNDPEAVKTRRDAWYAPDNKATRTQIEEAYLQKHGLDWRAKVAVDALSGANKVIDRVEFLNKRAPQGDAIDQAVKRGGVAAAFAAASYNNWPTKEMTPERKDSLIAWLNKSEETLLARGLKNSEKASENFKIVRAAIAIAFENKDNKSLNAISAILEGQQKVKEMKFLPFCQAQSLGAVIAMTSARVGMGRSNEKISAEKLGPALVAALTYPVKAPNAKANDYTHLNDRVQKALENGPMFVGAFGAPLRRAKPESAASEKRPQSSPEAMTRTMAKLATKASALPKAPTEELSAILEKPVPGSTYNWGLSRTFKGKDGEVDAHKSFIEHAQFAAMKGRLDSGDPEIGESLKQSIERSVNYFKADVARLERLDHLLDHLEQVHA